MFKNKINDPKNTFQYVLYEGSNDIQVNYLDITSFGEKETIAGIENATGTVGLQYPLMETAGNYKEIYVRYTLNQADPPVVTTGQADFITATSVTLNGMVNPNGVTTISYFEYGTNEEYGLATASKNNGSGTSERSVSGVIDDLTPETVYHYRLVAANSAGTSYGEDKTFTTSITPVPSSSSILYFPHVTSNREGWETEICVINTTPNDQIVNGVFRAYNDSGLNVSEDIAVTLNPHGRRQITVGNEFIGAENIGYIVFEVDSGVASGYMKFYVEGAYRAALPAVSSINTGDIYIPHIASDSTWWTDISLLNTTSSPRTLEIEFDNGETKTVDLSANEQRSFLVSDLFEGQPQDGIHAAFISDANGIVGLELFNEADSKMSGILLNGETSNEIYYPHIANKGGWETGIVAYNPSNMSCAMIITPYDDEGNQYKTKRVVIEGKEKFIGLVSDLEIPEETAWVKIWSTEPITGFELFAKNELLAGYTGVGISRKEGVFPKLDEDGATGIAFVNLGSSIAGILLTAYDDSGNAITTETIELASNAKVVALAPNLFNQDISSATYITFSSDMDVVVFQLNGSSDGMMLDALPGM